MNWARRVYAATPLWTKLVASLLALVILALVATGVVGVYALRGYLMDRVDSQLLETAARYADRPISTCALPDSPAQATGFYLRLSGRVECQKVLTSDQSVPAVSTWDDARLDQRAQEPFTVAASGDGYPWRVLVLPVVDASGAPAGRMTIALSLREVEKTVGRLVAIEVVVGAAVLGVLAALGYTAIRSSLRPLVEVEATAAAIAGGDLTRRVPHLPVRTEVGRLAEALNGMLAQIETALRDREAAAERAQESEARMRRFVADASHELRTPLTAVRGFAELMRQQHTATGQDGSAVLAASNRIEQAAIRMGALIEDLLLLARLDQQRPLAALPVDLLALATEAVVETRVAAPDHPITLVVRAAEAGGDGGPLGDGGAGEQGEPPVVRGDEARLRQVIGNLLGNACQHTPPGTAITVSVGVEAGNAVLEVADEGPGLDPRDAARVFERFYRVDAARNRASGGTGLGLSIVDGIVSAHGGSVAVRSAPGQGARFVVTLPLESTI